MPDAQHLAGETLRALAEAAMMLYKAACALSGQNPAVFNAPPAPLSHAPTLAEVVNQLIESKAVAGRSDGYLEQLHVCFRQFARGLGSRPIDQLTVADLERWLYKRKHAARTVKGKLQYLRLLFAFAIRRGYCSQNPALAVDIPTQSHEPPGIHTPEEVRKVLAEALKQHPGVARCLALRYFAGLRRSEALALPPEAVDLVRLRIGVSARIAKTRARRLVAIQPNLAAWLAAKGEMPGDMEKRVEKVWRAAGVSWPRNAPRHSFVSYHLAHFGSAAKTALEAGHSEAMLFAYYREMVTPEAAAEYWTIRP